MRCLFDYFIRLAVFRKGIGLGPGPLDFDLYFYPVALQWQDQTGKNMRIIRQFNFPGYVEGPIGSGNLFVFLADVKRFSPADFVMCFVLYSHESPFLHGKGLQCQQNDSHKIPYVYRNVDLC